MGQIHYLTWNFYNQVNFRIDPLIFFMNLILFYILYPISLSGLERAQVIAV